MSVREKRLRVHFVMTDLRPTDETLEFIMLMNAVEKQGISCSYEDPRFGKREYESLDYKISRTIIKKSHSTNWMFKDFIILQKVYNDRPKWDKPRAWSRVWAIMKTLPANKQELTKKHTTSSIYLVDNQKVFDSSIYKEHYSDKFSMYVNFGFDPNVLSLKTFTLKTNTILVDNLTFSDEPIKHIDNFRNLGWQVKHLSEERNYTFSHRKDYEKAKVLLVCGKENMTSYPVLNAMAYGVLIIRVGKWNVNHLNRYNSLSCSTIEDAYIAMIRYLYNPSLYQEYIESAYHYFALTQDINKNSKHIIESICRFMSL